MLLEESQMLRVLSKYVHIYALDFSAKFSVSVGKRCVLCGCVSVCWVVEKFKSNSYIAIYLSKHHPHDCMHCLPLMFLPFHFQHKIKIGL